jgi:hypothetical protein
VSEWGSEGRREGGSWGRWYVVMGGNWLFLAPSFCDALALALAVVVVLLLLLLVVVVVTAVRE